LRQKGSYNDVLEDSISKDNQVEANYSTDLTMTKHVKTDKKFKEPTSSKNTLCKKHTTMELIASDAQKKQAVTVNRHRVKDT